MTVKRVQWVSDVSRARSDVQTALGLLMAVPNDAAGDEPPDETTLQYARDSFRLIISAGEALDRACDLMSDHRKEKA